MTLDQKPLKDELPIAANARGADIRASAKYFGKSEADEHIFVYRAGNGSFVRLDAPDVHAGGDMIYLVNARATVISHSHQDHKKLEAAYEDSARGKR